MIFQVLRVNKTIRVKLKLLLKFIKSRHKSLEKVDWARLPILLLGLTTRQPLWVILCRLSEKGRTEIEEIVVKMKERDREEGRTGMKVKKQKK